MNINKFFFDNVHSDFDCTVSTRQLTGSLTKNRYKTIKSAVRRFNKQNEAPYGYSRNGYAYTCGCEHDCCGCIHSIRMGMYFDKVPNSQMYTITLKLTQSYNY
jgi:hypothetical protein